jgi:LacI family transcriptional regulator
LTRRNTLEDVAKAAGVGKVTVSYVLNGRASEARISEATSRRVLEAAKELDYRPNALARMLQNHRTDTVAVVFQYADYFRSSSSFLSEVMRGICDASVSMGVDVLLHTKPATDSRAEADALTDGRVDGALMLRDQQDPVLDLVMARKFPIVLFFSRSDDPLGPFVDADNLMGGRLAVIYLMELGHQRIGMVRGSTLSVASNDRHCGYRNAVEAAGQIYDPTLVIDDHEAFVHMMKQPDRPTALFVWSDDVAFSCIRTLGELGLKVPQDVSVIGFDSTSACEQTLPPLTSVRQPIVEMASSATQLLVDLVHKRPGADHYRRIFPPNLEVRGSTAPPKSFQ